MNGVKEYIFPVYDVDADEYKEYIGFIRSKPELTRCKDCKYWLPHHQFGFDSDNDEYHDYCEKHLPEDDYYAFEKNANDYCSWAKLKEEKR